MREWNPGFKVEREEGFPVLKFITVGKLKELLSILDDDLLINAQSVGNTGNLGIYEVDGEKKAFVGYIEFGDEEITVLDEVRK